ncbi:hypothetical protein O53_4684 [Microcystis aeruginosa TAIHU98]|uniref:Uncharacterized protein n=1 Tax=Microcystis aeruginosa TAIHU98 TaxID=1134457 RepID=L7E0J4_MICAE|nr:hypothetical protein O53_4684 [Microcystis aeruginosa TAIHU98]
MTPDARLLLTPLLSAPEKPAPQVTTEPSLFRAANAQLLEKIWVTP